MTHLSPRARYVSSLFGRISARYDLLNAVMSAGRHHSWRRLAVDAALGDIAGPALDIATGTGDLALELARRVQVTSVVGIDFSSPMLEIAVKKAITNGLEDRTCFVLGDAISLPFADSSFVFATVGFGLRNFADLRKSLAEMARVVSLGGRVTVLEIVPVEGSGLVKAATRAWFRHATPLLGAFLAGDREAYTYLPESVAAFPDVVKLAKEMSAAGLHHITVRRLALGTVAVLTGQKA